MDLNYFSNSNISSFFLSLLINRWFEFIPRVAEQPIL